MVIPADLQYLESHEWCRIEGDVATIGISDYAQDQLGDVVYLELPDVGTVFDQPGAVLGTIESVKAASDLYTPVAGEVIAVNHDLDSALETINSDPYGAGWMIRIRVAGEPAELLDAAGYQALLDEHE